MIIIDNELGVCSIYSFLYSYRKDVNSPLPEYTSEEATPLTDTTMLTSSIPSIPELNVTIPCPE